MALIDRLPDFWEVTPTEPLGWRSAVRPVLEHLHDQRIEEEMPVMDAAQIRSYGGEYHQVGGMS
jgi:hypothetical protein